jgi:hypothetical protein
VNQTSLRLIALLFVVTNLAPAQSVPPKSEARTTEPTTTKSGAIVPYQPMTGGQRLKWFVNSTVGPETLAVGIFSAGLGTARNSPKEYGGSWEGFGKRYGMRLTGTSTSNAMEAGFGAAWAEDPRYFRAPQLPFGRRMRNVVSMTFLAHNREGQRMPAYARYLAVPGSSFLSNTWRVDSDATTQAALLRTVWGFAGSMGKNAFVEFWPDVQRKVFHRKH